MRPASAVAKEPSQAKAKSIRKAGALKNSSSLGSELAEQTAISVMRDAPAAAETSEASTALPVEVPEPSTSEGAVPITDEDIEKFFVPEELSGEEKRLQEARQAKAVKAEAAAHKPFGLGQAPGGPALGANKFKDLEDLLFKSEMYSKFLAEQMKTIQATMEEDVRKAIKEKNAAAVVSSTNEFEEPAVVPAKAGKGRGTKRGRAKVEEEEKEEAAAAAAAPVQKLTPTQELLPLMNGELRDYQLKGVKWMVSLYQNGINGILADQMGLGKTVQTIGFISHMIMKGVYGPYMIIGPLSTLPNWVSEFQRFLPCAPVLLYHGSRAERDAMQKGAFKVPGGPRTHLGPVYPKGYPMIVTSYEIVMSDIKFLQKHTFKYIIVDEGHRLKNFECKLIRELRTLPTANKLLLSGTPLQNNLGELWSLLNFLAPELFSSLNQFEEWFDLKANDTSNNAARAASEQRAKVVTKLHAILRPFVLRRIKADVEIDLPLKKEILLYAPMSDAQRKINQSLLDKTLVSEMSASRGEGGNSSGGLAALNNMLMQMRKNCNHPDLITSAFTQELDFPPPEVLLQQCGKLALLDNLLKKLHARGHKVLIFSQMTKMLDLIQSYIEQTGHKACRIDGSIKYQERKSAIDDFNKDPNTWLFLLSTRAGGLGINLTAADTVIIYDSDWNPTADMQAMDRCHRIGQRKAVLVFRLATANSVEGRMLRRAAGKMELERLVIKRGAFKADFVNNEGEGGNKSSLSAAELLDVLRAEDAKDDIPQSGVVSEADLALLLDRSYLELGAAAKGVACTYPSQGVGFEVVDGHDGSTMLASVNDA